MHTTCQCWASRAVLCCWGLLYRFFSPSFCGKTESGMKFCINMQTFTWGMGWGRDRRWQRKTLSFQHQGQRWDIAELKTQWWNEWISYHRQRELLLIIFWLLIYSVTICLATIICHHYAVRWRFNFEQYLRGHSWHEAYNLVYSYVSIIYYGINRSSFPKQSIRQTQNIMIVTVFIQPLIYLFIHSIINTYWQPTLCYVWNRVRYRVTLMQDFSTLARLAVVITLYY